MQGSDSNENKLRKSWNSLKGTWLGRSVVGAIILSVILWIIFGALPDASIGELLAAFAISIISGLLLTGFVIRECCMPPREYQPIGDARVGPIDEEAPPTGLDAVPGVSVTPIRQPNGPVPVSDSLRRSRRRRGGRVDDGAEQTTQAEASLEMEKSNTLLDRLQSTSHGSITAADVPDQVGETPLVDYLMSPGGQVSSTAQIQGQLNLSSLTLHQQAIEYVKANAVDVGRALVEKLKAKAGDRAIQINGTYVDFLQRVLNVDASRLGIDNTQPYVVGINQVLAELNNSDQATINYGALGNSLATSLQMFNDNRLGALFDAARNVADAVTQVLSSTQQQDPQTPLSASAALAQGLRTAAMNRALDTGVSTGSNLITDSANPSGPQ